MAKTVCGPSDEVWNERLERFVPVGIGTHKVTRSMRKSEERLIPWQRGPQTRWERIKRAAVG